MADCPEIVGVRNIVISFRDCDTDVELRNIFHKLASDVLPVFNLCPYTYTALPGGKVQKSEGTGVSLEMEVQRVPSIPSAYYTGCAALDVTLEYYDGSVITFLNGAVIDSTGTDGNTATITAIFKEADELLSETQMEGEATAA